MRVSKDKSIFLTIMCPVTSFSAHEDTMLENGKTRANRYQENSAKNDLLNASSAILTIGLMLTLVSLLADVIGYGTWGEFGIFQTIGTIVGIMIVMIGLVIKILVNIFS